MTIGLVIYLCAAPIASHSSRPSERGVSRLMKASAGIASGCLHQTRNAPFARARRMAGDRRGTKVNDKTYGHADPCGGKTVMPAKLLAERAADQGREKRAEIDT